MRPHVRPMQPEDVEPAAAIAAAAFSKDLSDETAARRWLERTAYPLSTDPDGAFVAELDGRVIGVAEAMVRERVWCLSLLAVEPGIQSGGAGGELLGQAMSYRNGAEGGLIVSSNDPRALRLYAESGFELHPTLEAEGPVDRRALPGGVGGVQMDDGRDLEALAPVTRAIRGAPYTGELRFVLGRGGRLLRLGDRGFAVVMEDGALWALVARDEEAARALLWNSLGLAEPATRVRWITAGQQWAIDVLVRARVSLRAHGALCVRGRQGPLRPFLPTSPFA